MESAARRSTFQSTTRARRLATAGRALLLRFKQREELAVAFFLQLIDWDKAQRCRIDAIAQTCWSWAIVENVAEVRSAGRLNFGPIHSVTAVAFLHHMLLANRLGEAGPSRTAVEFIE